MCVSMNMETIEGAEVTDRRSDGFAELYETHAPAAYRLALRLCGDSHLAEEVVADACARVLVSWRRRRLRDPGAYLRRAVVNGLNSGWRRRAVERRWQETRSGDHRGELAHEAHTDDSALFDWALAQLPSGQRAVVVLRYYEHLSEAEIARALGVSRGTVKSQASRALHALRKLVEGSEVRS